MKRCYLKSFKSLSLHKKLELNSYLVKNLKRDGFLAHSGRPYLLFDRNYCVLTGRPRSIHFLFKVARMELKKLLSFRMLVGVRKAS